MSSLGVYEGGAGNVGQCDKGEVCSRNDGWVLSEGGIASMIDPEAFLVCNGEGQVD